MHFGLQIMSVMNDQVRKNVCIVGCGHIASRHAKLLRQQVNLFFCSRDIKKAQKYSNLYNGHGIYSDFKDVISDPEIDAVILCTPPEVHCEQILSSIEAHKSILVEKPMVISPDEVQLVGEKLKKHPEVIFMVAENYMYKPSLNDIKKILRSGNIGEPRKIYIQKQYMQNIHTWKKRYSALYEGGIHFIALLSALLSHRRPTKIDSVFPVQEKRRWSEQVNLP
ncbi:MAG: Gfo/Idh/MocA family oxidoreductase [Bdellovibrionota bacterium]